MKTITNLLIELETINKELNRIESDPEYIRKKAAEVFKGKSYKPDPEAIKAIFDEI